MSMTFYDVMKIKKRMCDKLDCEGCPASQKNNRMNRTCSNLDLKFPEKAEEIYKKWADEHPEKTILSDFLEKYPNAQVTEKGYPSAFCPHVLGYGKDFRCDGKKCLDCWNRPLSEVQK